MNYAARIAALHMPIPVKAFELTGGCLVNLPADVREVRAIAAAIAAEADAELTALRERVAELERAQWQPIKPAPKDGSWLLLFGATFRTNAQRLVCRWDGESWESGDDGYKPYIEPTYWMPLPEPPFAAINKESA